MDDCLSGHVAGTIQSLRPAICVPSGQGSTGSSVRFNLIIRYHSPVKTITATEASRHFSDLLDAVERGETVTIVRGNRPVAEIAPAHPRTGAGLRAALADTAPPDEEFSRHIAEAVALLRSEVSDPWADA